ncbi:hypothetical protein H4R24_002402 [Coemansia sp. RSA 988]|nr:hypothetical protein H4R24_002402 [Coemansia sp. RSA 988]
MVLQSGRGAAYLQSNSRNGLSAGDIDGTAADSGEGSSNRGVRGRGSRLNSARKTVFQPTVRAPPLGMQGQGRTVSDTGRNHVETKAGHLGLVLVNRKPTPTSTAIRLRNNSTIIATPGVADESLIDSGRSESDCSTKANMSNPWTKRLQTKAQQQTAQNSSKLASNVSRRSLTAENGSLGEAGLIKTDDVSVRDGATPCVPDHLQLEGGQGLDTKADDVGLANIVNGRDEVVSDCVDSVAAMEISNRTIAHAVSEPQTINRPQLASGITKQLVSASTTTSASPESVEPRQRQQQTGFAIDVRASDSNETGERVMSSLPTSSAVKISAPAMEIERIETPAKSVAYLDDTAAPPPSQLDAAKEVGSFLPENYTWGSRARTAASKSTQLEAEPSKSRWWKASLSGGARKGESALHPETLRSTASPALPSPPASSSPKPAEMYRSNDGDSRSRITKGERGGARVQRSSRRAQAPVPTVVPPVVLARATVRTLEPKPASGGTKHGADVGRAGTIDANPRGLRTAIGTNSDDGKVTDPIPQPSDEHGQQQLASHQQIGVSLTTGAGETAVTGAPSSLPAPGADMAQILFKDEAKTAQRNGVVEKDILVTPQQEVDTTSKSTKRPSTNGAKQIGSWRSSGSLAASTKPQPQALELVADTPNPLPVLQKVDGNPDSKVALQRRGSSSTRALAQTAQPGGRRERSRAATSSLAGSWRAASNRAKNDADTMQASVGDLSAATVSSAAFMPGSSAVLSNGAVIPKFWTSSPMDQQPLALHNGVLAHNAVSRESSVTRGLRVQSSGDAYYASSIGLCNSDVERGRFSDLLHLSEPQARNTSIGLSPPLLPHTMLADILGDGEHTSSGVCGPQLSSSGSVSGPVAASAKAADVTINTSSATNDSLMRGRRISSVIGIRTQGETESVGSRGLDYGSRVRSSSSLFDANRSSTLATSSGNAKSHLGPGFGDSGLLMRPAQTGVASTSAEFGYLPVHDPPAPQGRPTQPAHATTSNGRMWDYPSMLSTQAMGHPFYADNSGGLMFGAPPASSFSAFSSGAAMLWSEPAARPLLSHEISRPPSREDNGDQHVFGQSGRAPRPIGTRGAPGSNGAPGMRDKNGSARADKRVAPPPPSPPPVQRHQQQWQLHYPMQPSFQPFPHAYTMPQQQQQHAQLVPEPGNYYMGASAALNAFGEIPSGGSHNSLSLGPIATHQQQSGTVSSASPLVYPYAYPGGHPMVSEYHAQQPQHYVQYTSTPLPVHEASLHMAMMPVYTGHVNGQPSGAMVHHPALAPMHSQSSNAYVSTERWPDNQGAYLQQPLPAQQQHDNTETRMPNESTVHAQVSVADSQKSVSVPTAAAPVAESQGLSPAHNAVARNTAPKPQRVRHSKGQKPRGGNNSERRVQNKATAPLSSGSDVTLGTERSGQASGSRRSSRADRGRKPSKGNAASAAGEEKPQTARRGRGTHQRSGTRKQSTNTTAVVSDCVKD